MRMIKVLLIFLTLAFAMAPEMKLKRVHGNIYMVRGVDALPSVENRGFMSNAFAVLTKEGWVVIDALSTPELSKEFVENLMRVKKAPIKYAIITHYHPDHWYGARTYKELGAKIIAHKRLLEFYQSGEAHMVLNANKERFKGLFDKVVLVPPDIVVEGMDTGAILSQEKEEILEEDNLKSLSERLSQRGADLLVRTLKDWFEGKIEPIPQDHKRATYAPPIQKEEYRICWKAQAESVKDRIRGLYPDCYTFTEKGERVKVLKVKVVQGEGSPGEVLDRKRLIVACGEGAVEVLELISPKGKLMSGEEFMRGYKVERFY